MNYKGYLITPVKGLGSAYEIATEGAAAHPHKAVCVTRAVPFISNPARRTCQSRKRGLYSLPLRGNTPRQGSNARASAML